MTACFVTGPRFETLDKDGFEVVVHHDKARMDQMGEWCQVTHGNSGLTQRVLDSNVSAENAASQLLAYIKRFVPEPRQGLLAGNTVHADKAFLRRAPYSIVTDHLHYRILDVSTFKEAAIRWAPLRVVAEAPPKKGLHDAREDILESIEEAKYFRDILFKPLHDKTNR
ncbi:MAG: hypothetical protein M1828_001830 [Chrysothrix sp. TS-e1954]|nr:MAG: hypothetical protein M1828_001830 [Chrysothrix sp. TS-e1954]